ncbi:TPA: tail fiber assembly protein [Enterobacter asburiae]|nr:tail fiber assembly protein [Enterobacter asburiae]
MITLKNFVQYEPEFKDFLFNAIFLKSEDGLDWYYHMSRFQADTLKICYDSNNIIRSFSYQADRLFPLGLSVTEVDAEIVPDGLTNTGTWMYANGKISQTPVNHVVLAGSEKSQRMAEAAQAISLLQDAVDLSMATEAEEELLSEWKKYRILLNRIDTSNAPDVEWPQTPVNN